MQAAPIDDAALLVHAGEADAVVEQLKLPVRLGAEHGAGDELYGERDPEGDQDGVRARVPRGRDDLALPLGSNGGAHLGPQLA